MNKKWEAHELKRVLLEARAGTTIFASTGVAGVGHPDRMSTLFFYKAAKGSKVQLLNSDYYFNIATYSLSFDEKYIYTYSYQDEQSWTTYNNDLNKDTYRQSEYVFDKEVFFRICLKRMDGKAFTEKEAEQINDILLFLSTDSAGYKEKVWFKNEVKDTVEKIQEKRTENSIVIGLLSDTHVTVNGTWEDTVHNIGEVHKQVGFDAIVHLGDLTDGMVPAQVTQKYVRKVISDLSGNGVPLYIVLGNHDSNYFYSNPEPLNEEEQYEIYHKHIENYLSRKSRSPYYYIDFDDVLIRCLFLTSFDYQEDIRYGFSEKELDWVQETLLKTPKGYSIIVFCHAPPIPELDYEWSQTIRNGHKLLSILEEFGTKDSKNILALIHGHTHADFVYTERSFPIVSIGCSKCECFIENKPNGSVTQERKLNTVTQELWDTLVITPDEKRLDFVRFGAGDDRTLIL